ncbi:MMPL family transporter [Propionibacteriaceae bacterium Y1923]|uniref:MMPL family transporter n=1 Tax=Aestuariimicrobium sp. Y1814 TaxID=3418742 RepID=UPI003C1F1872
MSLWAGFLSRNPLKVLIACLLIGVAALMWGLGLFDRLTNGGFEDPNSQSSQILDARQELFGNTGADLVLLYHAEDGTVTDPEVVTRVTDKLAELDDQGVQQAIPWFADPSGTLVSEDQRSGMVLIYLDGTNEDERLESFDKVREAVAVDGLETHIAGIYPMYDDINDLATTSIVQTEIVALPIVFLLSIVIFGSLVAALMPTMIGIAAIIGSFALLRTMGYVLHVNVFAVNVVTILGMGLAIDYALFVVTRFREELAALPDTSRENAMKAVVIAMKTAGRTVLFSGLTVAVSMASLMFFPQEFLKSMGVGGMAAVLVAMVSTLTLLPAVLVLLGGNIDLGRLPFLNRPPKPAGEGAWHRLATAVMKRPFAFLVPIVIALVILTIPFFGVKWGSIDEAMLPRSSAAVIAVEKQEEWFGTRGASADVLLRGPQATDQATLTEYIADLQAVDGVQTVAVMDQTQPGEEPATLLQVTWEGLPQSDDSQQLVRELRAVEAPEPVLVGGATAATVDLLDSVGERLPLMFGWIAVTMFVLLFLAFGSVVLPIKALLMNVLSLGAAFGVTTWIFADGHLEGLLGFTSPGYLDPTEPLLMFAVLFGLSMDYEVFLLSRVKEEYDKHGDNTKAVAVGMENTGRLITSAALLLCVVVMGFAVSPLFFMKMIGVGMLVAIVLDATVVRALLVPATMRLLGKWNWWSPPGLRWVAQKFSLSH